MFKLMLAEMRPHQWIKNLIVFAALIFARKLGHMEKTFVTVIGRFVFCLVSSSIYMFNDILDIE